MTNIGYLPKYRIVSECKSWNHYEVTISIAVDYWKELQRTGQLGVLYGIDVSNEIYRRHSDVYATNPTVSDRDRARKGFKIIRMTYMTNQAMGYK